MSFGSEDWRPWVLEKKDALPIIERAFDLGINFFDTANMYSHGESERILGEALTGHRDDAFVATKCYFEINDRRMSSGLSRKTVEQELDASLERLGIDTVDLYQIHRWDYDTPIGETIRALDDAVRRGKARYVGASSMWAHQFAEALRASEKLGLESFATMQNHYNAVYREERREMMPLCEREGIGVIPWSPLARGYLTRPDDEIGATERGEDEEYLYEHPYRNRGGREVNSRVQEIAEDEGLSMAQVALAWVLSKDVVDAPIVGVTSIEHLEQAVDALEVSLSESDIQYIQEPYEPVEVSGHE